MPAPNGAAAGAAVDGEISAADLELHKSRLDSVNASEVLESIQFFRKKLSVVSSPPIRLIVDANLLPDFLHLLKSHPDKVIQYEAAWCLTNVASGDSEMTRAVVDVGALPVFASLISLESAVSKVKQESQLCEQCVWAVGNICGDSTAMRDLVIAAGVPAQMAAILRQAAKDGDDHGGVAPAMLRNAVWCSSNLFRGKPKPRFGDELEALLDAIMGLINVKDEEALTDIIWGMSYACEIEPQGASAVANGVDLKILVDLAKGHDDHKIRTPALRILGNLVSCEEHITQAVIDAGGVECFFEIVKGGVKKSLVKEALWSLSNVAAGTKDQAMTVALHPHMQELCARIPGLAVDCQKEGLWIVANACQTKDTQIVDAVVAAGGMKALIDGLKLADPRAKVVALEGLECMLAAPVEGREDDDPVGNPRAVALEEQGGLSVLEALQHDESHDVYRHAQSILVTYFAAEDDAGEEANVAHINEAVDAIQLDDD